MSSRRSRKKAPRISINGVFLDEVRTRLEYRHVKANAVALMSRPAQHHQLLVDGENVILRTPAVTALQLYYDGVLPVDREQAIELKVGRKKAQHFIIESLRLEEGHAFGEPVLIRLARIDEAGEPEQ